MRRGRQERHGSLAKVSCTGVDDGEMPKPEANKDVPGGSMRAHEKYRDGLVSVEGKKYYHELDGSHRITAKRRPVGRCCRGRYAQAIGAVITAARLAGNSRKAETRKSRG